MPKDTKEERYRWLRPILDEDMTIKALAKVSPFSERTLKYWLSSYRKSGIEGLAAKSTRPKAQPRETTIRIREKIIELRKETKLGALKLKSGVLVPAQKKDCGWAIVFWEVAVPLTEGKC